REDGVGFSDGTNGYIGTGTNIFNEFNDFYQYTSDCLLLPIGLTSFSAAQKSHSVILSWTTASELNNKFFTVEKSLDAIHFETLTVIEGNGTSTSSLSYEAEDLHPFTGLNYYRLKQTDYDGTSSYSGVVSCRTSGLGMMNVLAVNPNPVQTTLDITTDLSDGEDLAFRLFTTNGQPVFEQSIFVNQDIQHILLNVSDLQPGIYLLHVNCEYGNFSQKVIKIN
ncbi:MAG: T9SS type A sorting domain-containing protein, partial [Chitinophagales bacterium]